MKAKAMKASAIVLRALGTCALAVLAACNSTMNGTNTLPQGVGAQNKAHKASPDGDLLYVDDGGFNGFDSYAVVYTYPQGKHAGKLTGFFGPQGECSDSNGDVFIVTITSLSEHSTTVYEYAHGGSTPIATLSEPGEGYGCSIDPTTGNLAVANLYDETNPYGPDYGDVAVFPGAQGSSTMYYPSTGENFYYCGYDDTGNLYLSDSTADGLGLARLPSGGNSIESVNLDVALHHGYVFYPSVQWDGKEITVSSTLKDEMNPRYSGPINVYQLSISGSSATVVGTTTLKATQERHRGQSWIQGGTIIGINYYKGRPQVTFWKYPEGGMPTKEITHAQKPAASNFLGLTISLAPSRSGIHR